MTTGTAAASTDVKEWRRRRAWELHQQDWSGRALAAALGVTPGAGGWNGPANAAVQHAG